MNDLVLIRPRCCYFSGGSRLELRRGPGQILLAQPAFLPSVITSFLRGEEQNREEGEMAQKKLGGGRNRGKK